MMTRKPQMMRVLQTHEYETLCEDSISEIEKERGSPVNLTASIVRMDNIEYVPVEKVGGHVCAGPCSRVESGGIH